MRIAVLSSMMPGSSVGGVETHIRFICKELQSRGHKICLFKPTWKQELLSKTALIDGLEMCYIPCGTQRLGAIKVTVPLLSYPLGFARKIECMRTTGAVYRAIDAWQPDVVWQHDFTPNWLATKKLSSKYPIALTNHTAETEILKKLPFFNAALSHYSLIIGPSSHRTPLHAPCPSVTIYNGIDPTVFNRLDMDSRNELRTALLPPEAKGKFVVFSPGRWAPVKGVLHLARAMSMIAKSGHADKFLFIFTGDGHNGFVGYKDQITTELSNSGASFMRLGDLDIYKMRQWYQISDLVVIPSMMEGFSVIALESMACGTPVLASALEGLRELINDGNNGYLATPGNSDEICSRILSISEDTRRFAVADNAFQHVSERHLWATIALQAEGALNGICRAAA